MFTQNLDPVASSPQEKKLEENADAAASSGRNGSPGNSQSWKWTQSKNQAGIEAEIDKVGQPQHPHGHGSITGSTKDGVDQKQHYDNAGSAQHDAAVSGSHVQNTGTGAH